MKQLLIVPVIILLLINSFFLEINAQLVTGPKPNPADVKVITTTGITGTDTLFFEYKDTGNYKIARSRWDELPEFPGGEKALNEYVMNNTTYPQSAIDDKIEGRVFIRFNIDTDGSPTDIQVFIGLRSDLNDECVRVVKEMPKWKPGTTVLKAKKGFYRTTTKWSYSIPFAFSLIKGEKQDGIIIYPK